MNRMSLLREAFAILKRNPALWSIALIGLAIDFAASWVFLVLPGEVSVVRTLLAFLLAAFTSGALIQLVNTLIDQQPVTLRDGLRAGLQHIWQLLAINVILFVPVWFAIVLLSGSVLTVFTSGLGQPGGIQATDVLGIVTSLLGAGGLVIVLILFMNLIGVGAERAIVLQNEPVITALKSGWKSLAERWRAYLSVGLALLSVVVILGLAFTFLVGPLLSALAGGLSQTGETATPSPALLFSPANIAFMLISLVVNSLFTVFASGVWTLVYRQWHDAS